MSQPKWPWSSWHRSCAPPLVALAPPATRTINELVAARWLHPAVDSHRTVFTIEQLGSPARFLFKAVPTFGSSFAGVQPGCNLRGATSPSQHVTKWCASWHQLLAAAYRPASLLPNLDSAGPSGGSTGVPACGVQRRTYSQALDWHQQLLRAGSLTLGYRIPGPTAIASAVRDRLTRLEPFSGTKGTRRDKWLLETGQRRSASDGECRRCPKAAT